MSILFKQRGFTLVEMIVALAVFSVVVTIAVGALLTLIAANEQLQKERNIMTNLSFALDSMTREIRTGTKYYCDAQNSVNGGAAGARIFMNGEVLSSSPSIYSDCSSGNNLNRIYQGISFIEGGDSITGAPDTRLVYFYNSNEGKIYRRVSGGSAQSIVSSDIFITDAEFFVTGSKALSMGAPNHNDQPSVTIFIEARKADDTNGKLYQLQTTVTQRTLDI